MNERRVSGSSHCRLNGGLWVVPLAAAVAYITANGTFAQDNALTTDYALKEDVLIGHLAATWTMPGIRVMAGFRIEKTNVNDATASTISGVLTPQTRRFDYTEFLPNVQVAFQPASNFKVRLAYTETIARPETG